MVRGSEWSGLQEVWGSKGWDRQIMADSMRRVLRQFQDGASLAEMRESRMGLEMDGRKHVKK